MKKGLIGKKLGMTQIFDEKGNVIPVTVVEAGPCVVAQIKTTDNDGYEAIQLGFGDVNEKHLSKPAQNGIFSARKDTISVRRWKRALKPANISSRLTLPAI